MVYKSVLDIVKAFLSRADIGNALAWLPYLRMIWLNSDKEMGTSEDRLNIILKSLFWVILISFLSFAELDKLKQPGITNP